MAPKLSDEKKSHMVTIRMDRSMKANLDEAASENGRSLSGEIQHRLADYESKRAFVDRLLDDGVAITAAVGMETIRKGAISPIMKGSLDESLPSLERAIETAACISNLFDTVADHAGDALTEKTTAGMIEAWTQRREVEDLEEGFDLEGMAPVLSAEIVKNARKCGRSLASSIAPTIGPYFWDVCFDKDDKLRSTAPGMGYGLMGTLLGSSVGLPSAFQPPLQTEADRQAFVAKLKKSGAIRAATKLRMSEGQYPGMSEEEVIDKVYGILLKPFGMDPGEAVPDVATG